MNWLSRIKTSPVRVVFGFQNRPKVTFPRYRPPHVLPKPGDIPLKIREGVRVLLITENRNNLTRRIEYELSEYKANCETEVAHDGKTIEEAVSKYQPEIIICPYMKTFVPESVYSNPNIPCLIVHPGIPGDKGASSIDWSIHNHETEWGVSVIDAAETFDGGDIWSTETFTVPENTTKTAMYNGPVTDAALLCTIDAVSRFCQGIKHFPVCTKTNEIRGTFQRNMKLCDRRIDWTRRSEDVVVKVRMSDTTPGAVGELRLSTEYGRDLKMNQNFRLFDAYVEEAAASSTVRHLLEPAEPGQIIAVKNDSFLVKTGDGNGVWIGQMKEFSNHPQLKLPATHLLTDYMRKTLPKITDPCAHDDIRCTIKDEVCQLEFDFYNGAMSTTQARRLTKVINDVSQRKDVKLVTFMGGERFFSTGIHLCVIEHSKSKQLEAWENINAIDDVIKAIASLTDKVTVAVLRGNAGAGGAMMACACDVIVAHPGTLITPTYKAMNLYGSEYWTYFLHHRVGRDFAEQLTSGTVSLLADQAYKIGLIDAVLGGSKKEFETIVPGFLEKLLSDGEADEMIKKKLRDRDADWFSRLEKYREEELSNIRRDFSSRPFLEALYKFVYKLN